MEDAKRDVDIFTEGCLVEAAGVPELRNAPRRVGAAKKCRTTQPRAHMDGHIPLEPLEAP